MTIILIVKFMSEIITSCRRDYQPEVSKDSQRNRRIPVLINNDGMLVNVPKGTLLKFFFVSLSLTQEHLLWPCLNSYSGSPLSCLSVALRLL